jgi:hypothetical protein
MKLFRFASTAALCVLMAGVVAAQSSPQTPPAPPAPPADQATPPRAAQPPAPATDAADITIVGCLAQATDSPDAYTLTVVPPTPAAPATAPTASAPTRSSSDATRAGNPNPGAGATDAARAAAAAVAPGTYKIVGIATAQLKPHVNHQVELKGRLNAPAAAGLAQAASAKEFKASSVKMLSATCPPAK